MKNYLFCLCLLFACSPAEKSDSSILQIDEYDYKIVENDTLSLKVYRKSIQNSGNKLPAIVFYFGGGWTNGDYDHFKEQSKYLASRGIVAITPEYRIKSIHHTTPYQSVQDARSAMRWIFQHAEMLGVDTSKVVFSGGSAGGHLALSTYLMHDVNDSSDNLNIKPNPYAFVLFNPVVKTSSDGYGANKTGEDSIRLSPFHRLNSKLPPIIIFHGTDDKIVSLNNINEFKSKAENFGSDVQLIKFPGRNHGFFNIRGQEMTDFKESLFMTDQFLIDLGLLDDFPTVYSGYFDSLSVQDIYYQGFMVGEINDSDAVLQVRLVMNNQLENYDVTGQEGWVKFDYSTDSLFEQFTSSKVYRAEQKNDFIVKHHITDLLPGKKYFVRLNLGSQKKNLHSVGHVSFYTLPIQNVSFVVYACGHHERFWNLFKNQNEYSDSICILEKHLGFPGFKAISELQPHFIIPNGDVVYYDHTYPDPADTLEEMQAAWHRLYQQPRFNQMASAAGLYFMKDDHDYRYNDADTLTGNPPKLPGHELGINTFLNQTTLGYKVDTYNKGYRTIEVSDKLQLWLLEGRDYRSPNHFPDDSLKSIWGKEQLKWLKNTLLSSTATYKLIISPTPLIGPDDAYKNDNHVNPGGFQTERNMFFTWLKNNGFVDKNLFFITGDRHWQYHSIDTTGFEEFSSGALVQSNARMGRPPGDPASSDPYALIKQPFTSQRPTGGFLHISIDNKKTRPQMIVTFYDRIGTKLYQITR